MITTITATVIEVLFTSDMVTKFTIYNDGKYENCINYNQITGEIRPKDCVILNTTAVQLELGTGGYHFVIHNLTRINNNQLEKGHIMKMKYTPCQFNSLLSEAQESKYHDIFDKFESLEGIPVFVGSLHSMLAPTAICLKDIRKNLNIVYIMTDSGALPIWISDIVNRLKNNGIISYTITCGNSFGGDLECVNIYTSLIAAKEIYKADAIIICMGPGIVGTDTKYGFSGLEQAYILDAVNTLGGKSIAIPRISFIDVRKRHYGISHHTLTVLGKTCNTKVNITIPIYNDSKMKTINAQLKDCDIKEKHNLSFCDFSNIYSTLVKYSDYFDKMGKGLKEDIEYFVACGTATLQGISK